MDGTVMEGGLAVLPATHVVAVLKSWTHHRITVSINDDEYGTDVDMSGHLEEVVVGVDGFGSIVRFRADDWSVTMDLDNYERCGVEEDGTLVLGHFSIRAVST